jgi:uncharacterized protein (DUF433 family)
VYFGASAMLEVRKVNMPDNGSLQQRITVNPSILVGKPTIRGLRISVEQILRALAHDVPKEDLLKDYPDLEPEDIQACLAYAAERLSEERVYPVGAR